MTKKITIPYFPKGLKYTTPLCFVAETYLILLRYPIWGAVLILTGAIIVTTNYVTEINLKEKSYRDYLSLLGLTLNEESKTFNTIDRIIITKGRYSQTINTRVQSRQLDWSDYTGTLILDNDATLNLLTKNDKKELLKGLKEFTDFLKVGIEDRTTNQYHWIDMNKI